jgi:hypothetical protein
MLVFTINRDTTLTLLCCYIYPRLATFPPFLLFLHHQFYFFFLFFFSFFCIFLYLQLFVDFEEIQDIFKKKNKLNLTFAK